MEAFEVREELKAARQRLFTAIDSAPSYADTSALYSLVNALRVSEDSARPQSACTVLNRAVADQWRRVSSEMAQLRGMVSALGLTPDAEGKVYLAVGGRAESVCLSLN